MNMRTCASKECCPHNNHPTSVSKSAVDCVRVSWTLQEEGKEAPGNIGVARVDIVEVFPQVWQQGGLAAQHVGNHKEPKLFVPGGIDNCYRLLSHLEAYLPFSYKWQLCKVVLLMQKFKLDQLFCLSHAKQLMLIVVPLIVLVYCANRCGESLRDLKQLCLTWEDVAELEKRLPDLKRGCMKVEEVGWHTTRLHGMRRLHESLKGLQFLRRGWVTLGLKSVNVSMTAALCVHIVKSRQKMVWWQYFSKSFSFALLTMMNASYLNPTLILGPWLKCQYLLSCQGCLTWWRPALEAGRRRKTTSRTDVAHFTRIWPPAPILTHFRAHLESSHDLPSSGITSCPHQSPGITGSTLYLGNALMHASQ